MFFVKFARMLNTSLLKRPWQSLKEDLICNFTTSQTHT